MNTPSHAIVNLAILGNEAKQHLNLAIALGGILPDVPIFVFYIWARFISKMPARQIWTEGYYQPFWQDVIATFHSIPLVLIGLAIAYYRKWSIAAIVFASMILHDLLDLPVHHDDAHRHFFPFSNYRFISPISYWDPDHYGNIVVVVEIIAVLISTIYAIQFVRSPIGKGLMILVNIFYIGGYVGFYMMRR